LRPEPAQWRRRSGAGRREGAARGRKREEKERSAGERKEDGKEKERWEGKEKRKEEKREKGGRKRKRGEKERGEGKKEKREKKEKGKEEKKEGGQKELGHYRLFIVLSTSHNQEKLFCQMFSQNGFSSTEEFDPPAQPQPEPELCQTHP
jgi:hypothetical protein